MGPFEKGRKKERKRQDQEAWSLHKRNKPQENYAEQIRRMVAEHMEPLGFHVWIDGELPQVCVSRTRHNPDIIVSGSKQKNGRMSYLITAKDSGPDWEPKNGLTTTELLERLGEYSEYRRQVKPKKEPEPSDLRKAIRFLTKPWRD